MTEHPAAIKVFEFTLKKITGAAMLSESDRRIEQIYQRGLERIKVLTHFHRPKCIQIGCVRKLSAKDDRSGHTLCEICHAADLKAKRLKKHILNIDPAAKFHTLCPVKDTGVHGWSA